MEKITTETAITEAELAAVLGISARHVRRLTEDGIFQKEDGRYILPKNVQIYIKHASKANTDEDKKTEQAKRKAEAMLKASKAQVAKLEADELAGKMHRSEDIEILTNDLIFAIRDAIMSLEGRLSVECAAASTPAEAAAVIRKEKYKILRELASYRYDPDRYEERVRDRMAWDFSENSDE